MSRKGRVFLISLGCAKNLVDSEHILGFFRSSGYDFAKSIEDAETAVINTCGFISDAVQEAIDTIIEVGSCKGEGKLKRLFVTGCLVQRYGYKLLKEFPEVDGWLGTGQIHRIGDLFLTDDSPGRKPFLIGRPTYLPDHTLPRVQTTPFYTSYLRIAEGCSHSCSFCIIPRLRGPFRSRSLRSLVAEAEQMADRGVKEINIIAQDTTMYGQDLAEKISLDSLLVKLTDIKGIRWIRLLYCHPFGISERLLELMESEKAICPYIDVPFQHVNRGILSAMGRDKGDRYMPWKIIKMIRSGNRRISLRTTLMVGFPGETEKIFEELCEFVKAARFDHMGAFIFSPERGSKARLLKQPVEYSVAKARREKIMAIQSEIARRLNADMIGTKVPVLIEGKSRETDLLLEGRTICMAPDTDSRVLINKGRGITGEIMDVLVKDAHPYDLVGEIIE